MPTDGRAKFERQANSAIRRFVAEHPEFSIDTHQPDYRGGTNYVLLGHLGQQPVIFKYFVTPQRWTNEHFCLRHFAPTGYVPRILTIVPEQLIVMTRLPGQGIGGEDLSPAQVQQVSRQIGQALAVLVQTPLPEVSSGYSPAQDFRLLAWGTTLGDVLKHYLRLCRQVQAAIPAYQTPFYTESLMLVEQQVAAIDQQPRILFHEDVSNLNLDQGVFQGFYDLEMCRLGTEAMQLGVAVELCRPHWLGEAWLDWRHFISGYQSATGRELDQEDFISILAMNHFYHHIRVCRWGEWAGDPAQKHHLHASAHEAEIYLGQMREACYVLRDWIELDKWFPSL